MFFTLRRLSLPNFSPPTRRSHLWRNHHRRKHNHHCCSLLGQRCFGLQHRGRWAEWQWHCFIDEFTIRLWLCVVSWVCDSVRCEPLFINDQLPSQVAVTPCILSICIVVYLSSILHGVSQCAHLGYSWVPADLRIMPRWMDLQKYPDIWIWNELLP